MRKVKQLVSFFLFTVILFSSQLMYSQVTTSAMNGTVVDQNGSALPGANVIVVHISSGTQYGTSTRPDGKYNLLGLRVGGPYKITVSMIGYTTQVEEGFTLSLGQNLRVDFKLPETAIELKGVTVTAEKGAILSAARTGAATSVSKEAIDVLPTINRRIEDVARLTPQYGGSFSFAGVDNRLNNMTIDGSYFNNSFGLSGFSGSSLGDRTGVAAISLDAIEQVQVNIAPYDVRQGNFVGAGINAVTKSGTNEFSGSAYYNYRHQGLVGTKAKDNVFNPGTFKYDLVGARLGGPIIQNKLFFFVSYEDDKTIQPGTTFRANQGTVSAPETVGGNITRVFASDLDALSGFLQSKFNYATGAYQGYDFAVPSTRFLAKLDYNLNDKNKISVRYTQLDSKTDVLLSNSTSLGFGNRRTSTFGLNFANSNYAILENIRSVIGEWNSVLSDNMSNNLIVGYTSNDESRESKGSFFPMVDILNGGSVYTTFGFEPFTPNNELRYSSYQFLDNFSIYGRDHNLTFGVSAEIYKSENVFFPGSQSIYVYNSLADFYTDANDYLANPNRTASPITLNTFQVRWNNIPGQEKPVQPLEVFFAGVYAQDEWQFNKDLKLTLGLRIDVPFFGDTGYENALADALTFRDEAGNPIQYSTKKLPDAKILWSPRVGFNWDVKGDRSLQIRGGTGIFTGKPAYVWISNQIGNTGVLTGSETIRSTKTRPFNPDPNKYKKAPTGGPAALYQLALTDKDFKFPQTWRTNFAVDHALPWWGLIGTAEILYNRDVNGIYYIDANLPAAQTTFKGVDNRPRWFTTTTGIIASRINQNVEDATVIKNQNVGYNWSFTASIEKPFSNGLFYKLGYNYGEARNTIDPGSIARGSWTSNQMSGDPNNPGVSFSSWTPGNRLFAALTYRFDYFKFGSTTISFLWDYFTPGFSSYVYSGDLNGDGGFNDLIYIPRNKTEMNFQQYTASGVTYTPEQQAAAWDAYIKQDAYLSENRGKYAERNAVALPMISRIDLSFIQEVYSDFLGKRNTLQIRADILNFGNLISKNWGVGQSLISSSPLIVPTTVQGGPADSGGKAQYRLRTVSGKLMDKTFQYNAGIGDVYRIQFSIRYIFN